jgi:polysaccharide export outer membrane protein
MPLQSQEPQQQQPPLPPPLPRVGPSPAAPAPLAVPQPVPDAMPVAAVDQDYVIGRGDVLRIAVFGHPDLGQTGVVQANGTVAFPLVGAVKALDQTPAQVQAALKAALAKGFIRDPQVTVVVQEVRSKFVFVIGEVTRPGTYPLAGDTRVVEMVARAGPLSPEAGSEIVVVRPAAPTDRPVLPQNAKAPGAKPADVQHIDMRDIQGGQLDKNIVLKANDTVFVPKAARIFVSGEVRNAGAFPFTPGLTSRQAISLAGGFTEEASTGNARVVRMVDGKSKMVKLKLDDPLQPGDTVVVKRRWF